MPSFEQKRFSVYYGSDKYNKNFDRIFRKKKFVVNLIIERIEKGRPSLCEDDEEECERREK